MSPEGTDRTLGVCPCSSSTTLGMRKLPHTAAEDLLELIIRASQRGVGDAAAGLLQAGKPGVF